MAVGSLKSKYRLMQEEARSSIILTICGVLQKGISFLIVPVYTRIMPSNAYGEYSVFLSWIELISIFATLNMWNYLIINGMTKYEDDRDKFISSLQGLSATLTLIWFVFYLMFNKLWEKSTGLSNPVMLAMFVELLTMPSFQYWCQRKRFEYEAKSVLVITIVLYILFPMVSIPFILIATQKGIAAILGRAIISSIVYCFPFIDIWKKGKCFFNKEYWKYALKFNLPLIPHFLSMMVLSMSDRIMIERMCSASDAALYSVANSAGSGVMVINTAVLGSFIPFTYQNLKKNNISSIKKNASKILLLIGTINLIFILAAPEIISILGTEEYKKAIYVIPPIALSNMFMFLFNLFVNIEYYFEQTKQVAFASVVSAITNVVLNYICLPKLGFIAAGYTTLICYIIYSLGHYVLMRRACNKFLDGIKVYDMKGLIAICIGCLVVGVSVILIFPYAIIRYSLIMVGIVIGIFKRKEILTMLKK